MGRRTRILVTTVALAGLAGALVATTAATPSSAAPAAAATSSHRITAAFPSNGRPMLPRLHPERVNDPVGLARAKADAEVYATAYAAGAPAATDTTTAGASPTQVRTYNGVRESNSQPSDSTSAIGTSRHIETINTDYAIYSRTGSTPLATGPLTGITGCATASCANDNVFDPQIIWDGQTNRFFFAADDVDESVSPANNYLSFGFSKTASPGANAATDWCRYVIGYGTEFPDYPKLGDSKDFGLIGVNVFGSSFLRSDLVAIGKPPSGTTCPNPSTFAFGIGKNLRAQGGTAGAFTPVPANQTDANATGYAVARLLSLPSTGGTALVTFKITKNATTGQPVIQTTGDNVTVPAYKPPADVPQPGTGDKLDSSDTRPSQAVSAVDPLHGGKVGLWTQHTVLGGPGAQVRWYEIDPVAHTLLQTGTVTSGTSFVFNGAISPDRVVKGTTSAFGGNMLITVNQGSSTAKVGIYVASKKGTAAQSTPVLVKLSTNIDQGFGSGCSGSCRWGDYAAASPDPGAATTGASGAVWITSMYNGPSNPGGANWATWNAAYRP